MKLKFIKLLFIFITSLVYSQENIIYNNYKKQYPNDNLLTLKNEEIFDIDIKNNTIVVKKTTLNEQLFLNDVAAYYSKESVGFSSFNQIKKIEASSLNWDKNQYKETKVKDFKIKDELKHSFHDDYKTINFIYPNLNKGAKTVLYTEEEILNPRFLGAFYFGESHPHINSKLTLIVNKDINIKFKEYNTESHQIKFSKEEKKNKVYYTWESSDIQSIKIDRNSTNMRNYFPHIFPIISDYKSGNKQIKLATDVADLYNWYHSLIKNINPEPLNKELETIVYELIKDKEIELEKVRALYYWVQKNIKYIAFEYELGGFIPRDANDVFNKKYGDCKDNSNILNEMLKIAGIKGYLTWIGTRDIPYSYADLCTPSVDNHMILCYINNGKYYFLDATGRYLNLELPSTFIQGKEALIGKSETDFEIFKIPIVNGNENYVEDVSTIKIINNALVGNSKIIYKGYPKIDLFNLLESIDSDSKKIDFYNKFMQKGNNKFLLSNIEEINKYEYDQDFKINFDFTIADLLKSNTDELYLNLNLNKSLQEIKIEPDRKTDLEVPYMGTIKMVYNLTIPDNYKLKHLPANTYIDNKWFTLDIKYQIIDNAIQYTQALNHKFIELKKEDFKEYLEAIKKGENAYKEIIILGKN